MLPEAVSNGRLGAKHVSGGSVGSAAPLVVHDPSILVVLVKLIIIPGLMGRLSVHKVRKALRLFFPRLPEQIQFPHFPGNLLRQNLWSVKPCHFRDIHSLRVKFLPGGGDAGILHAAVHGEQRLCQFIMPRRRNGIVVQAQIVPPLHGSPVAVVSSR